MDILGGFFFWGGFVVGVVLGLAWLLLALAPETKYEENLRDSVGTNIVGMMLVFGFGSITTSVGRDLFKYASADRHAREAFGFALPFGAETTYLILTGTMLVVIIFATILRHPKG